jgi:hypothetical protein
MASFLERVVPWPESEDAPGFVGLHYAAPKPDGKKIWVGKPFKTFAEFIRQLWSWYIPKNEDADFYFCTSMQKTAGINKQGKPKAVRLQANVACLKSFWADLDVKKDAYPNLRAALAGLKEFLCSTKLPPPTFIVGSGSGLHVYWTLNQAIPLTTWQPVANSLKNALIKHNVKCDTGCTVDSVRILRIPGTLNHKTDPAKPVELLGARETDYRLEEVALPLAPYADLRGGTKVAATTETSVLAGPAIHTWKKAAALKDLVMEHAGDGLEDEKPEFNLNADAIFARCPFFRETLATGGAKNGNLTWNLTTLAATFLPNGEQYAHDFAKGHETYTYEETQELYERKQREVEERGLRWPSCKAFESAGCTQCATCPLAGAIKSPLNLGLDKPTIDTARRDEPVVVRVGDPTVSEESKSCTVKFRDQTLSKEKLDLPNGYLVDQRGVICATVYNKKSGESDPQPLFHDPVWDPWTQVQDSKGNLGGLHFMTVGPRDRGDLRVFIPAEMFYTDEKWKRFAAEGCRPKRLAEMGDFLMSWQREIEQNRGSVSARAFGWAEFNKEAKRAFVYGERQWNADGTTSHAGLADATLRNNYKPRGRIEVWQEAAELVWRQKRPELELIVASAFAGPLFAFSGQLGGTLSVWSGESGVGKSTSMSVATAVWGMPKRTKEVLGSTQNALVGKIGSLGNLPVYWDEIKEDSQMDALVGVLYYMNEGLEKARMKSNIQMQLQRDWQTLLITGSNQSVVERMFAKGATCNAGPNRVLEFKVDPVLGADGKPTFVGNLHHMAVDQLARGQLDDNCGLVGLEYAKLIATKSPELDEMMLKTAEDLTDATGGDRPTERVWTAVATCCLLGASLANLTGLTKFRLPELRAYLVNIILQNRARLADEGLEGNKEMSVEETLTAFLRDNTLGTMVTDTCTNGRHDSRYKAVTVIRALPAVGARPFTVQFVRNKQMVRISRRCFREWLDKNEKNNYSAVMEGLVKVYNMTTYQGHLGAGTTTPCAKERLIDLQINKGTGLWTVLEALCKGKDGEGLPNIAEEAA